LTEPVGYQGPSCLYVKMEFVVGNLEPFRFYVNSISWGCFHSCGVGTIGYGKWRFTLHVQCCGSCM